VAPLSDRVRPWAHVGATAAVLLGVGCSHSVLTPGVAAITVVSGAAATDTAGAILAEPLVVAVYDSQGDSAPGVVVRFGSEDGSTAVAREPNGFYWRVAFDTTDGRGLAHAFVALGRAAGSAGVVVTAPEIGAQDTASYVITPAAPARLYLEPGDTALYVGRTYPLRATVTDQYGNVRADPVTFAASGAVASVSANGTVTGLAVGRGTFEATSGALGSRAAASVVPQGTIATSTGSTVTTTNLDGSGYHVVTSSPDVWNDLWPYWSPDGTHIVYRLGFNTLSLWITDTTGTVRRLLSADSQPGQLIAGQYSRDGTWIYLHSNDCNVNSRMWRIRPDGTGLELLSLEPDYCFDAFDAWPSPSPDGARLVYADVSGGGSLLRTLDLATGLVTSLDIPGQRPRWSPVSDWIAYVDSGRVKLMHADGSGQRTVSAEGRRYEPSLDWSPDAAWIVAWATDSSRLELIEVQSGMTLPLAFTTTLHEPSWRP
jgi:hypothetical protein